MSIVLLLIKRLKKYSKVPVCVGFGISSPAHVKKIVQSGADGVIVGSAIIDLIAENLDKKELMPKKLKDYIVELKEATIK